MKKSKSVLAFLTGIILLCLHGCSSDDATENSEALTLVGQWELSAFKVSDTVSAPQLLVSEAIIGTLIEADCKILSYDFRANGEVFAESTILYISTDPDNIACPTGPSNSFQGTWELEGDILTFDDGQGSPSEGARIRLSQNELIIYGEGLSVENRSGTEFILSRK